MFGQRATEMIIADEQVGRVAPCLADLEHRGALPDKAGHVEDRLQPHALDDAQGHHGVRMTVHDRIDVRALAIDLAVNESLKINPAARGVYRLTVQSELNDVIWPHTTWRHISSEQESVGTRVVPNTDMPEGIDDALVKQNMVGDDKILNQS